VALGLLAFDLAGGDAGAVLGTALAIKMVAYIGVAPIVGAFADRLSRRRWLVAMDLIRAGVALLLPFIDEVWQIYVLIFLLQSASAGFTPMFQATIPDVLPDERDYTRALSLSRLAYDLENLISPMLAAALLAVMSFHWLFSGTAIGFLASAALVLSTVIPQPQSSEPRTGGIYGKITRGARIYLKTPRLRALLAITLAAAAASAMVIVNTVVIVRDVLNLSQTQVALTLAAYGGGSMLAALLLPRLLDAVRDRTVMLAAAALLSLVLCLAAIIAGAVPPERLWTWMLIGWVVLGVAYSMSVTPTGRLLRRSANAEDRPTLFAAQFALSHGCWLIAYPLAGFLGASLNQTAAFAGMAALAMLGTLLAVLLWPTADPEALEHDHAGLPADHPHVESGDGSTTHSHPFVIDDLHPVWPNKASGKS
jgi:MFS family permease